MNHRKVLVTGGAGFLGSYLCERLVDQDCEVICMDTLFTGSKRNIYHLLSRPNFHFMVHDITVPFFLDVDLIFNMACPASPVSYQQDPVRTIETNVIGMSNILKVAMRSGARVFQASTSEIYGDPEEHPQSEGYWGNVNPIGVRSCYDEGKRCAETLCFDYARQSTVPVLVARIFNTYGPRMDVNDGRVISNFIVQALRGEPLTIYGSGTQTRSFCYATDLVEVIIKLMLETDKEFLGPVNIGNPVEDSIEKIAKVIIEKVESSSEVIFYPLPSDDPKRRCPDISLAKALVGWEPVVSLDEGLAKTISSFRENL